MRCRSFEASLIAGLLTVFLRDPVALGSTPSAKREVEGLERRRVDVLHPGEGDASLFAPDAIDIDGQGHVSLAPTAALMPPQRDSRPKSTVDTLGVHVYGDMAVTTGRQGTIRFVRVWHRVGDRWLIVASQTTPIAATPQPAPIAGLPRRRAAPALGQPEREVWAATVATGDAARSRNLKAWTHWVADEFLATSIDGRVSTKAERLTALKATASNGPTASHEDVRVRIYGDLSVATWAVPGTPSQRLMTIAVKRHGRWQRVAAIATGVTASGTSSHD
jgi:uncharacterized protein DUF4440